MTGNHCVNRQSCPINSRFRTTPAVESELQTFSAPLRTGLFFEAIGLVSLASLDHWPVFSFAGLGPQFVAWFPVASAPASCMSRLPRFQSSTYGVA
jgi:hypothetical protein